MSNPKIVYEFKDWKLTNGWKNNFGFYLDILERLDDMLAFSRQSQYETLVAMFILRFPKGSFFEGNSEIQVFLDNLRKAMYRIVKRTKPKTEANFCYLWKCEKTDFSRNHHYHLVICCSAKFWKNMKALSRLVTEYWQKAIGIKNTKKDFRLVQAVPRDRKRKGVIMLNTTNNAELKTELSYFAKVYSSISVPKRFDSSQGIKGYASREEVGDE